jgi:signal transduction histidine kinase
MAFLCWAVYETEFRRVDAFVIDILQFLNDPNMADKSLVTVNINGKKDTFARPFTIKTFTSVIEKLQTLNPKHIILCFSIRELNDQVKHDLLKYIKDMPNVFLQNDYSFPTNNFYKDPVFKNFPRYLNFSSSIDSRDKKSRRVLLYYDKEGIAEEFAALQTLNIKTRDLSHFKYHFRLWETDQINFKHFKKGTFGSFDARDVLENKISKENFEGKSVLFGSFDEFSMSSLASVFNFADKTTGDNFKNFYFPHVDLMASMLNTLITGDYVKYLEFNDLIVTFIILILIILLNIPNKLKIYLLLAVIPFIFITIVTTYVLSSFYINFSRSIVLLFFIQYLGIPIIMLSMFKEQETKKLQEINDARIDALLTVSEKVAHDIRSPLSAINLVMAKAKFDDPEYQEILDGAVKRIDETATKILTRYRTKTGNENEKTETINLSEIITDIVKEKRILNIKIDFEIVNNSETNNADGLRLDIERIVSNVIDNSIFALKNIINPRIIVALEDEQRKVTISITDNGTGIPEQVLKVIGNERITTKADTNQGNGIGLLHAKRVIERLNGNFEISSQENIGTTIKISLPKA